MKSLLLMSVLVAGAEVMPDWPTPTLLTDSLTTAETISGLRAVSLTSGSVLTLAQPGSGLRMPAIGISVDNALSGGKVQYVTQGRIYPSSGLASPWSGQASVPMYVGSGGVLIPDAGMISGCRWQSIGTAISGGLLVSIREMETQRSGGIGSGQLSIAGTPTGSLFLRDDFSWQAPGGGLTSGAVQSGHVASGQIGQFHVASGAISSGRLGVTGTPDGTKVLRDDFTWVAPGAPTINSGDIGSGKIASGAVTGFYGTTRHITSGSIGGYDLGSGLNSWVTIYKGSDEAKTNTNTLGTDTALQFSMVANAKYAVRLQAFFDTPPAADFKWRHVGPASPTLVRIKRNWIVPGGTAFAGIAVDSAFSAADLSLTATASSGGFVELDGIVHNGANTDVFGFSWAPNTAASGDTIVRAGSRLQYLSGIV